MSGSYIVVVIDCGMNLICFFIVLVDLDGCLVEQV